MKLYAKMVSPKIITYRVGGIGSSLAVVLSFTTWHSILWAILHGFLSWFYVIWWAIFYQS